MIYLNLQLKEVSVMIKVFDNSMDEKSIGGYIQGHFADYMYKRFYEFCCTSFAELCSWDVRGHYHKSSDCFEYPAKSLLKSRYPRKYLPNFPTPKNPGIENFKPKKNTSIIPAT